MNATKTKILEAAADLFAEKGFAGTSISEIAKKADINQSLIYHHIGNKASLWTATKQYLAGDYLAELPKEDFKNLEDFAKYIIHQRLELYASDPRIGRLVRWQILEQQSEELQNIRSKEGHPVLDQWAKVVVHLQKQGKVKKQYPANLICMYIYSALSAVLIDYLRYFEQNPAAKDQYIEMLLDGVRSCFMTLR